MGRCRNRLLLVLLLLGLCLGLPAVDQHYLSLRGDYTFLSSTIDGAERACSLSPAFLSSTGFAGLSLYQSEDDRAFALRSRIVLPSRRGEGRTRQIFKDGFLREERSVRHHLSLKLMHYNQGNFARHTELEIQAGFRLEGRLFDAVSIYWDQGAGVYFLFTRMAHLPAKDIDNFDLAFDTTIGVNIRDRLFVNLSLVPETSFYVPYNMTWGLKGELLYRISDSLMVGYEESAILNDYYFNELHVTRHERTIYAIWRKKV